MRRHRGIWQARHRGTHNSRGSVVTAARGAELLGLGTGMVVQELGWDEDTDPELRDDIAIIIPPPENNHVDSLDGVFDHVGHRCHLAADTEGR